MMWSEMNGQQRAFLETHARWRDVIRHGKLVRREPLNDAAHVMVAAFRLSQDAERRRADEVRCQMLDAVQAFEGKVRYVPTAMITRKVTVREVVDGKVVQHTMERKELRHRAGTNDLTKPRAGAMAMGFYKNSSFGG